MKTGAFLLMLAWLSGSTYAGYRLTDRSFGWIDEPGFGLSLPSVPSPIPQIDIEAIKDSVPPALLEQAKKLTPQQLLCLRATIAPSRVTAVLAGDITPQELAASKKCLE